MALRLSPFARTSAVTIPRQMMKVIPEVFAMLKLAVVEIKKERQVLMVNKTTSFKKKGQRKEGEL